MPKTKFEKREQFVVSAVYAPYQVSIYVYLVWGLDTNDALFLAEMYRGEGEKLSEEWELDITPLNVMTEVEFETYNDEDGWTRSGTELVQEIFHWSRG